MRRRWVVALAVLVVLDVLVLAFGYRARHGVLPPMQRTTTSFSVAASPSAIPTDAPGSDDISAPLLLGANADGVVLRATRGACEERFGHTARFWTGTVSDDAPLAEVEVPAVKEVLGLVVNANGSMRVAGLDAKCDPMTMDSDDGGASWQSAAVAKGPGIWTLPADTTATNVTAPAGRQISIGCVPDQIVNVADEKAIASCDAGGFYPLAVGSRSSPLSPADYGQLSVAPGQGNGQYLVLGSTPTCLSQVGVFKVATNSTEARKCLGGSRAPLAIATTPDLVIAQVGNDLMSSRDGGVTFTTVGPEPSESASPSATASPSTSAS